MDKWAMLSRDCEFCMLVDSVLQGKCCRKSSKILKDYCDDSGIKNWDRCTTLVRNLLCEAHINRLFFWGITHIRLFRMDRGTLC